MTIMMWNVVVDKHTAHHSFNGCNVIDNDAGCVLRASGCLNAHHDRELAQV